MTYAGFYFCRKAFYVVKGALFELGIDTTHLGYLGLAYLVAYTVGQFVSAALGSKVGPRILLLSGMAISIAANVAFGLANNFETFLAFMVMNGLAQATGWPGVIGTLVHWTRRAERGFLLGLWGTCYQLGSVLATSWAAFWLHQQGWRGSFFAASMVLAAVWLFVLAVQRNKPEDVGLEPLEPADEEPAGDPTEPGDAPSIWSRNLVITILLLGCFYLGVKFVRYAIWSWTPFLLQNNFHLAGDDAGYLSTVFDVAGFLGAITAGYVSDRLFKGRRATTAFIMLLGMLGGCGLLYLVGSQSVVLFAVSLGLVGFMLFGPDSLLTGAGAMDVGSRRAALATAGLINGMGSVGSVVQEVVVPRVYEANGQTTGPVFALILGASAVSVGCLGVVLWRNHRGLSDV